MAIRSTRISLAAILVLALSGTALVFDHMRLDSPTMDESFHSLASAEYVIAGTYYANLEHPPLAKLLAGVFLKVAGGRAPVIRRPFLGRNAEQPQQYCFFGNPLPPSKLFAAARRPFPILFLFVVLVVATAAWHWGGPLAGVGAAALTAFEPNLVAHAGILHTDLPASLGFIATVFLALLAMERRSLALWAATGVALGLSFATKFSAVFLAPILAILGLAHALIERRCAARERRQPDGKSLVGLSLAGLVSLLVLFLVYAVAMRSMPGAEAEQAERVFLAQREAPPDVVERVVRLTRVLPEAGHYAAGLAGIAVQNQKGGGVNFLRGRYDPIGFWNYFYVAFSVKSSLGFLLALLVSTGLVLARRGRIDFPVAALGLPVVYLFLSGMGTSYNIGIRHMLPAYPLLACAVSLVVVRALPGRQAAAVLLLSAGLQLVELLRVHPHELSFFNALVGGPERGGEWLNDSNLDWGQDLIRLARELERRGWEAKTTIAYFGGAYPPSYCPKARLYDPDRDTPLVPGLYAVSSFLLCSGPEVLRFHGDLAGAAGYEKLRRAVLTRGRPAGRVGYSIFLFRLPADGLLGKGTTAPP